MIASGNIILSMDQKRLLSLHQDFNVFNHPYFLSDCYKFHDQFEFFVQRMVVLLVRLMIEEQRKQVTKFLSGPSGVM